MAGGTKPGREVEVAFNLTCPADDVDPTTLVYKSLGMLRDKDYGGTVGDIDVTADKSEGGYRQYIDNYKEGTFSFSGVAYGDVKYNQAELHDHVHIEVTAPESQGRVVGYLQITDPIWERVLYIPVKFDEAQRSDGYDSEVSFTITGKYTGKPVKEALAP